MTSSPIYYNDWNTRLSQSEKQLTESISVIIPAKSTQSELNRCIAALDNQDLPEGQMEIIVVDHGSDIPLIAPPTRNTTKVLRLEEGYGPGVARKHGAAHASGDIFLFIDSDIIAPPTMVREYAKGPSVDALIVSLGFRTFVDPKDLSDEDYYRAIEGNMLDDYLGHFPTIEGQEWIDDRLEKTNDNLDWRDDLWAIVVGAGIGVSRKMYDYCGGFDDFEFHGVEDTEFGWRLFQAGAVIAPNRQAHGYHLGRRTISTQRDYTNRRRAGTLANYIPHSRYRKKTIGRQWVVPRTVVQVLADDTNTLEEITGTCDDALASTDTDLTVQLYVPSDHDDFRLIAAVYSAEGRLHLNGGDERVDPISSPYIMRIRAGVRLQRTSVSAFITKLNHSSLGLLGAIVGQDDLSIEFWRNAALSRAGFINQNSSMTAREALRGSFREDWISGADVGASRHVHTSPAQNAEVVAERSAARG